MLVAEDDAAIRRLVELTLRSVATIHGAGDGAAALGWLRSNPPPDLLITDVMMPGLDGLSLARIMKRDLELQATPIIFLTAKSAPRDVIGGINAGARHYLTKPFDRHELLAKVKDVLGIRD